MKQRRARVVFVLFIQIIFFKFIKKNNKEEYEKTLEFDQMLEDKQKDTKIRSKLYISKSRKRIKDLLPEECNDKQCFLYREEKVWNGF